MKEATTMQARDLAHCFVRPVVVTVLKKRYDHSVATSVPLEKPDLPANREDLFD